MADTELTKEEQAAKTEEILQKALEILRDPKAEVLQVRGNPFGEKEWAIIAAELPKSAITTLGIPLRDVPDSALLPVLDALPESKIHTLKLSDSITEALADKLKTILPASTVSELHISVHKSPYVAVTQIFDALPESKITTFNLHNATDISLERLKAVLPKSAISDLRIGISSVGNFGDFVTVLPQTPVRRFDLGHTGFRAEEALALAEVLPETKLESLTFSQGQLGTTANPETSHATTALFESLPETLTHLKFFNGQINEENAESISNAIAKSNIEDLDLSSFGLWKESADLFFEAFPRSRIKKLSLSGGATGQHLLPALASVLPYTAIEDLSLSSFHRGGEYLSELANALPKSEVKTLALTQFHIDNDAAEMLAAALPSCALTSLDLTVSKIGDRGMKALASTLPYSALAELTLLRNPLNIDGMEAFNEALPQSGLVRFRCNASEGEKTNEAINTAYSLAHENYNWAYGMVHDILFKPEAVTDEEWKEAAENAAALLYVAQKELRMKDGSPPDSTHLAEQLTARFIDAFQQKNILSCKTAILKLLPEDQAKQSLNAIGAPLKASDFLNSNGSMAPQFVCKGGIGTLFQQPDLWDGKNQAKRAYHSLPETMKETLPIHQILTNIARCEQAASRQRG